MNGTATTPVPLFAPEAVGIDNATLSNSSECDPLSQGEIELYMTLSWWFEGLLQVRKGREEEEKHLLKSTAKKCKAGIRFVLKVHLWE